MRIRLRCLQRDGMVGTRKTYLVGNGPTHTGDQDDTSPLPETRHLSPGSLRSEQDAVHVHVHHLCKERIRYRGRNTRRRVLDKVNLHLEIAWQGIPNSRCAF